MSDPDALSLGRLSRLQTELERAGYDGGLFYDPINIRYATGVSNMQVYGLHNPCRYVYVPSDGPTVLFDFKGCEHLSHSAAAVGETREAVSWYHFVAGSRGPELVDRWAGELAALAGSNARIAVDRLDPPGVEALRCRGVSVGDGQAVADRARVIKTTQEVAAIRAAVNAADLAVAAMVESLQPGRSEQEIWAELHRAAIGQGAEWFETRLLTSGPRTNPWYQEASSRVVEHGDLVALDTDLIGVGGYSVDISRTWVAGDAATEEQRRLHEAAHQQILDNIALLRPGASFAEISAQATLPPGPLHSATNACVAHGIGLCNEYPLIVNSDHFAGGGYDGEIEAGMVLCVESLVAPEGGREAVKLEEQVLVTTTGNEVLSATPFDQRLLS
jgi:Xaa-Pro aminopeptidase